MNIRPADLAPKRPANWATWERHPDFCIPGEAPQQVWTRGRLRATSSLIEAEFHGKLRWQWLVSFSAGGWRPTDDEMRTALKHFDMQRAEEDNHHPGVARHFFLLCDAKPDDPVQCDCKDDETVHVEPDGYVWSGPRATES